MQITTQSLTMLTGAPNRRERPSVEIYVLHSNTPKPWYL